jgi:DNA-binding XRE family transcriptional regulator
MSYGYSARVVAANNRHDDSYIGIKLGRLCIAHDIPVSFVASQLEVSRQTVYNWIVGAYEPHVRYRQSVELFIAGLESKV